MKDSLIYQRIKYHYNKAKEAGYNILFIALQGSQNYGLDLYTDNYKSDIDTMAIILPSFNDFVNNKSPVSTTIVLENNEHINIKDIRLMFDLYLKQNQQFLETLFTKYKIINKKYKELVLELLSMADDIADYDQKTLYNCIYGMAMEKFSALEHPYPSIKDKIDKYGYDGKQLHHIIRLNEFLYNLEKGISFRDCLTLIRPLERQIMIKAKLNEYNIEEARRLAQQYLLKINEVKFDYKENILCYKENPNREAVLNNLITLKTKILKFHFLDNLLPKQSVDKPINLSNYRNVFVTSDLHFGHNNILEYEFRKSRLNVSTIEEHDDKLINNWNNTINSNDLVYILGDFSFSTPKETEDILKRLNGDKILVIGNHDCFLQCKQFDRSLFKEIIDYKEIRYNDNNICMMHYPIYQFRNMNKETGVYVHLFGHIHSRYMEIPKHSFNVGVDVNNYKPININEAISKAAKNHGNTFNHIEGVNKYESIR